MQGQSNKEIASSFGIREDTVKHHLTSIFSKVGVGTRLELALLALERNLVGKRLEKAKAQGSRAEA